MVKKSLALTYLLWFFFGFFGIHRLYLEDMNGFLIYIILWLFFWTGICLVAILVFWIIDICLIPGLVRNKNKEILQGPNVTVVAPSAV